LFGPFEAHIPIKPGFYTNTVRMFTPVEKNNKCNEFCGVLKPSRAIIYRRPGDDC
jgi:hypothetical protein